MFAGLLHIDIYDQFCIILLNSIFPEDEKIKAYFIGAGSLRSPYYDQLQTIF